MIVGRRGSRARRGAGGGLRRLALLLLGVGGCLRTEPPDGALRCREEAPRCPQGFACAPDGTCWRDGRYMSVDMAVEVGGPPDLATTEVTLETPDASIPAPALSLLAGAIGGTGNADDVGAKARFSGARDLVLDGAGSVFIADTDNCTVRRLEIATGQVSHLAGTPGVCGTLDGIGAAARFHGPRGLALDGAGNLLVADYAGHTIRSVVLATGQVSTLAGAAGQTGSADGPGATARFDSPGGLAVEAGVLLIGDSGNHTIRALVLATGAVSTLAGTAGMAGKTDGLGAAARFSEPFGLATAGTGHVYVGDVGNDAIRRVAIATREVSTVAAVPAIADVRRVGADGAGNLFYTGDGDYSVYQLALGSGQVTRLAGRPDARGSLDAMGVAARFGAPAGVSARLGTLFIADAANATVRQLDVATQLVTTIAGSPPSTGSNDALGDAARFKGPSGLVADGTDAVLVSDTSSHTIRRIVIATGEVTTIAGAAGFLGQDDGVGSAARFYNPAGLTSDGAGAVFIADSRNRTIRKLVLATGEVSTLAGMPGVAGALDGAAKAAQFNNPTALVFDGAGALYIADTNNHVIRQLELSTMQVTTIAGAAGLGGSSDGAGAAARFRSPSGIETDHAGNLFVADRDNQIIRKLVLATKQVTTLAGSVGTSGHFDGIGAAALFRAPSALAFDGADRLYVVDSGNHSIRTLAIAGREVSTWAGVAGRSGVAFGPLPARLNQPAGLVRLASGALAISSAAENAILLAR